MQRIGEQAITESDRAENEEIEDRQYQSRLKVADDLGNSFPMIPKFFKFHESHLKSLRGDTMLALADAFRRVGSRTLA
jgi:hypothetical protein